ncbi:hypothetical protein SEA_LILPHARAOH_30 [Mycobacterium phage LilPharaoh]|uniref:Uncharacterized protein n=1 Tax=Mycobacterium phage Amelie TaxID=1913035 RepID=A0A1J0GPX3_9CAUD|nr:hypothetical protein AVV01_gp30 [Mycobacterium phage Enkosi]YP_009952548.1 hypothetical protein I5G92_gp30 [Mycobacterium phage Amelie]ATN90483.1 hypothetical protein SEA_LILPHARAOH_30 [Mycobacterium phage LilPharaoh]AVP42607.1 hypothetical protein SEA_SGTBEANSPROUT_30 [Mycobacterium phage SgtBeansprout]AXC37136.1 hypothetical protein SEA_BIGLEBOPS_30 [Mycobacterium phage Biglebops]QGJ93315.1 hypothetical protein PBI_MDAVU_30 [Mycobacterium phage Mdavu]UQS94431.1 hypothetical protein SEA_N
MSLAERLGDPQPAPSTECAVCRWLDQAADEDRAAFTEWLASGGSLTALWRACATDPDNPLTIKRPRFSELINDHHRGGARVAV